MSDTEYFGVETMPSWAQVEIEHLVNNSMKDAAKHLGISMSSVTVSAKLEENTGRVDFHTSLGVIPFRIAAPGTPEYILFKGTG